MAWRGSFVTEYVYCNKCFEAVKHVMGKAAREHHRLYVHLLPITHNKEGIRFNILAGYIGVSGGWNGEILSLFEVQLQPEIEIGICHKMQIVIFPDTDGKIIHMEPIGVGGPL